MIKYIEGTNEITNENITALWYSAGWINGSAKNPEKLVCALHHSDYVVTAWDDGQLIGLCSVIDDTCLNAWISYMVVNERCHNKGIGTKMLEIVKKHYEGFRLFVQTSHADKFYKKSGFKEEMHSMRLIPEDY